MSEEGVSRVVCVTSVVGSTVCCLPPPAYAMFKEHHVARQGSWQSVPYITKMSALSLKSNIMDSVCASYYSKTILLLIMKIV